MLKLIVVMVLCCASLGVAQVIQDENYDFMVGFEGYSVPKKSFEPFNQFKEKVCVSAHTCQNLDKKFHAIVVGRIVKKNGQILVLASTPDFLASKESAILKASELAAQELKVNEAAGIDLDTFQKQISFEKSVNTQYEKLVSLAAMSAASKSSWSAPIKFSIDIKESADKSITLRVQGESQGKKKVSETTFKSGHLPMELKVLQAAQEILRALIA